MARDLELDRDELPKYLEYLEKAELVSVLRMKANGDAILRKTFEVGGRKKGKRCLGSCIRVGLAKSENKSENKKKRNPLNLSGLLWCWEESN